jgi:class 3 adenylate cyclase
MGDIVNLSARLMAAAAEHAPKEGVLVDAATFSTLRTHYDFNESLPAIQVKGKEGLVPMCVESNPLCVIHVAHACTMLQRLWVIYVV